MPANSQFQKIISVLLIFILITELPGCVSSVKLIQIYDLPLKESSEQSYSSGYDYIVSGQSTHHSPKNKSVHFVKNISISNGYLTADREMGYPRAWNVVSIYVISDSLIKVTSDQSIKIALDDIYNVKVEKTNWFRFWVYTALAVVSFSALMVLIFGDPHSGNQI